MRVMAGWIALTPELPAKLLRPAGVGLRPARGPVGQASARAARSGAGVRAIGSGVRALPGCPRGSGRPGGDDRAVHRRLPGPEAAPGCRVRRPRRAGQPGLRAAHPADPRSVSRRRAAPHRRRRPSSTPSPAPRAIGRVSRRGSELRGMLDASGGVTGSVATEARGGRRTGPEQSGAGSRRAHRRAGHARRRTSPPARRSRRRTSWSGCWTVSSGVRAGRTRADRSPPHLQDEVHRTDDLVVQARWAVPRPAAAGASARPRSPGSTSRPARRRPRRPGEP